MAIRRPVATSEAPPPSTPAAGERRPGSGTFRLARSFLVVDDDTNLARGVKRVLRASGGPARVEVVIAKSVTKALVAPRPKGGWVGAAVRASLAGDGISVAEQLRDKNARMRVVMLVDSKEEAERALLRGLPCAAHPADPGLIARFAVAATLAANARDESVAASLASGAPAADRIAELVAGLRSRSGLSRSQAELLEAHFRGTTYAWVDKRGIDKSTVRTQSKRLREKLGVSSMDDTLRLALREILGEGQGDDDDGAA